MVSGSVSLPRKLDISCWIVASTFPLMLGPAIVPA